MHWNNIKESMQCIEILFGEMRIIINQMLKKKLIVYHKEIIIKEKTFCIFL